MIGVTQQVSSHEHRVTEHNLLSKHSVALELFNDDTLDVTHPSLHVFARELVRHLNRSDRRISATRSTEASTRVLIGTRLFVDTSSIDQTPLNELKSFTTALNKRRFRADPFVVHDDYDPEDACGFIEETKDEKDGKDEKMTDKSARPVGSCGFAEKMSSVRQDVGKLAFTELISTEAGATAHMWAQRTTSSSIVFWMSPQSRIGAIFAVLRAIKEAETSSRSLRSAEFPLLAYKMLAQLPPQDVHDYSIVGGHRNLLYRCGVVTREEIKNQQEFKRPLVPLAFMLSIAVPLLEVLHRESAQWSDTVSGKTFDVTLGFFQDIIRRVVLSRSSSADISFSQLSLQDRSFERDLTSVFKAAVSVGANVKQLLQGKTTIPTESMRVGLSSGQQIQEDLTDATVALERYGMPPPPQRGSSSSAATGAHTPAGTIGELLGQFNGSIAREWRFAEHVGVNEQEACRLLHRHGKASQIAGLKKFCRGYQRRYVLSLIHSSLDAVLAALGILANDKTFKLIGLTFRSCLLAMDLSLYVRFTYYGAVRAMDSILASGEQTHPPLERLSTAPTVFRSLMLTNSTSSANEVLLTLNSLHRLFGLPDIMQGSEEFQNRSRRILDWIKTRAGPATAGDSKRTQVVDPVIMVQLIRLLFCLNAQGSGWTVDELVTIDHMNVWHITGMRQQPMETDPFKEPIAYVDNKVRAAAVVALDECKRTTRCTDWVDVILKNEPGAVQWILTFVTYADDKAHASSVSRLGNFLAPTMEFYSRSRHFMREASEAPAYDCTDSRLLVVMAYAEHYGYCMLSDPSDASLNPSNIALMATKQGLAATFGDARYPACRVHRHACLCICEAPIATEQRRHEGPQGIYADTKGFPVLAINPLPSAGLRLTPVLATLVAVFMNDANFHAALDACNGQSRKIAAVNITSSLDFDLPVATALSSSSSSSSNSSEMKIEITAPAEQKDAKAAVAEVRVGVRLLCLMR